MKNVRAMIECGDGFKFSVVANPWVMCTDPEEVRDGIRHWRNVELASSPDELITKYASPGPEGRARETYEYVPLSAIKDLVRKHGGVSIVTKWCRVCDRT